MGEAKRKQEDFEKQIAALRISYKQVFETDDGKKVLSDLEKRYHFYHTTNIKGDSHESAYMEGQRSVLLFIKQMLLNDNEKGR
jgi:hypothetical protein